MVPYVYIEADEDHVAYQNGTNQEIKLVYVHEGYKEKKSKNRRAQVKITRRKERKIQQSDRRMSSKRRQT